MELGNCLSPQGPKEGMLGPLGTDAWFSNFFLSMDPIMIQSEKCRWEIKMDKVHLYPSCSRAVYKELHPLCLTDHSRVGLDLGSSHGNRVLRSRPWTSADTWFGLGVTKILASWEPVICWYCLILSSFFNKTSEMQWVIITLCIVLKISREKSSYLILSSPSSRKSGEGGHHTQTFIIIIIPHIIRNIFFQDGCPSAVSLIPILPPVWEDWFFFSHSQNNYLVYFRPCLLPLKSDS